MAGNTCCSVEEPRAKLRWTPDVTEDVTEVLNGIESFSRQVCWEVSSRVATENLSMLSQGLRNLDACPHHYLTVFLQRLCDMVKV